MDSTLGISWKPIDLIDNIPKYGCMFSLLCLCSAKWTSYENL